MKKTILACLVATASLAVHAAEVTTTNKEYAVNINTADFSGFQAMYPRVDFFGAGITEVAIGDEKFENPTYYLWHSSTNPDYAIVGAGEADDFLLSVKNKDCAEQVRIKFSKPDYKMCGIDINFAEMH